MAQTTGLRIWPKTAARPTPIEQNHEFALATRIAGVKLILATLNFFAILLDDSVPAADTPIALVQSLTIASLFFGYILLSFLALKRNWVTHRSYRVSAPFLDLIFCALLIIGTDGYRSPFNLWLVMCIVSASFSSDQRIVYSATGFALILQTVICFIPQSVPIDARVFVVRTGFIFGFGLVIAYIGNHIARKTALLIAIDNFASEIANCDSVPQASSALLANIQKALNPAAMTLDLDDGSTTTQGDIPADFLPNEFPVETGHSYYGTLRLWPSAVLTSDDSRLLHTILDRFGLTLRRLMAAEDLRQGAAQEARLRVADELHDTHIQTLTAIDLQIEALGATKELDPATKKSLQQMRTLARDSMASLRAFLAKGPIESSNDLDEIVARCRGNWPGELEISAEPSAAVPRAAWVAIELLLREGLANARRHARADWARFTLETNSGTIVATLYNNGLSPELPLKRYGYGLSRVAAAIAGAGGAMRFEARPQGGAILAASFGELLT